MPNQALAYHRVSSRVYDLTNLRTGNVRDQLLRSTLLARGLIDEGLLTIDTPLLVLGGGAAGMMVAMTAATRKIQKVTVIEKDQQPFATLAQASFRRIDPTEYDWPHAHWTAGTFPIAHKGSTALTQKTGTGGSLANSFLSEFRDWEKFCSGQAGQGKVEFFSNKNALPFVTGIRDEITKSTVEVLGPWDSKNYTTEHYGAVVICFGFGVENTCHDSNPGLWGNYSGHRFWADDDNLWPGHTPLSSQLHNVVISGGGDGALQDLQRALTGWFGKELFNNIDSAGKKLSTNFSLQPDWLRAAILDAEDFGRRAHAWKSQSGVPGALLTWHKAIEKAVANLVNSWKLTPQQLYSLLQSILRPQILSQDLHITWVLREETPGFCYALNRFLVLLIQKIINVSKRAVGWETLPGYEITRISPLNGHRCVTPGSCFGHPHTVEITPLFSAMKNVPLRNAELILIRHGISSSSVRGKAPVPEQMVPFDLPH